MFAGALIAMTGWGATNTPDPNGAPNPYTTVNDFFKLPEGRKWGSTSAVEVDSKGHIWVAERCGANSCAGKTDDPILEFDATTGKLLKSFGSGTLIFPHGICIDKQDNIWVTDGQVRDGKGNVAIKFSPEGKVLMTLGKPGVAGDGKSEDTFNQPNDVAIAPNGDIFVAEGHNVGTGTARIVKFDKDGKYIMQFGKHGSGPGEFEMPHALAFDSKGRLFVGDRGNNRVQIFDQSGKFIADWHQFGRPSGIFIDKHDVLYSTDSESQEVKTPAGRGGIGEGYGFNPGFKRGIRIGSAKTGKVTAFIPDADTEKQMDRRPITSAAEGVAADAKGNVYGAEVGPHDVKKYVKKK
jgi:hypothetical protein